MKLLKISIEEIHLVNWHFFIIKNEQDLLRLVKIPFYGQLKVQILNK